MGKINNYKDLLAEKHRLKAEIKKDEQALKDMFTTVEGIMGPVNLVRKFSPFLPAFFRKPAFVIGAQISAVLISRFFSKKKNEDQPGLLESISPDIFFTLGSKASEWVLNWFGKKKSAKEENTTSESDSSD